MRVIIQRVASANVSVNNECVSKIERGFLLLVGITHDDDEVTIKKVADKIANIRIFNDEDDKMNLSLNDIGGEILSVSQFTLYADIKKGRRPSFINAAKPEYAHQLYQKFNDELDKHGFKVVTGVFQTEMKVELVNDGPVTIIVDSSEL